MGRHKNAESSVQTIATGQIKLPIPVYDATPIVPAKVRKPRKKREAVSSPEDKVISTEIRSGEPPQKCAVDKKNLPPTTDKLPRITVTTFDERGHMISTTFVCDPNSLQIARNEQQVFSAGGKPKKHIFLSIETNVVEIE
jgi:hypothetical protein